MAVIVYSMPHCPKCAAAKALLRRNNVSFEEFDVKEDKEKARQMVEKRRSVRDAESRDAMMPIVDIGGTIIEGFDKEKMLAALREKGLVK